MPYDAQLTYNFYCENVLYALSIITLHYITLSTLSFIHVPFLSATEFSVADYDSTPCGVVRRRRCRRGWRWRECSN